MDTALAAATAEVVCVLNAEEIGRVLRSSSVAAAVRPAQQRGRGAAQVDYVTGRLDYVPRTRFASLDNYPKIPVREIFFPGTGKIFRTREIRVPLTSLV